MGKLKYFEGNISYKILGELPKEVKNLEIVENKLSLNLVENFYGTINLNVEACYLNKINKKIFEVRVIPRDDISVLISEPDSKYELKVGDVKNFMIKVKDVDTELKLSNFSYDELKFGKINVKVTKEIDIYIFNCEYTATEIGNELFNYVINSSNNKITKKINFINDSKIKLNIEDGKYRVKYQSGKIDFLNISNNGSKVKFNNLNTTKLTSDKSFQVFDNGKIYNLTLDKFNGQKHPYENNDFIVITNNSLPNKYDSKLINIPKIFGYNTNKGVLVKIDNLDNFEKFKPLPSDKLFKITWNPLKTGIFLEYEDNTYKEIIHYSKFDIDFNNLTIKFDIIEKEENELLGLSNNISQFQKVKKIWKWNEKTQSFHSEEKYSELIFYKNKNNEVIVVDSLNMIGILSEEKNTISNEKKIISNDKKMTNLKINYN